MSNLKADMKDDVLHYIKLTHKDGEEYVLEFNRDTVVTAQAKGFDVDAIGQRPTIVIPDLFYFAMRMHHRSLARNQVDAIRVRLFPNGIPAVVIQRLVELYQEASLLGVLDDEDIGKNADTVVEM